MIEYVDLGLPNPSFIQAWTLEDLSVCDRLIDAIETSSYSRPGTVLKGSDSIVVKDHKDSLDLQLMFHEDVTQHYCHELSKIYERYTEKFFAITTGAPLRIEAVNVQKYVPGAGFHGWHTERTSDEYPSRARVLVYMTYLNDVTDGGETEWMYQGIKVKPRKGLTVMWPADWTHTHRGVTSPSQTKYIATGWFQYYNFAAPSLRY